MAYTYIVECNDHTLYVGSTIDLDRRLVQHNDGSGARYTAERRPVRLIWSWQCDSIREAYCLEKRLQGWSQPKKRALVEGRFTDLPTLSRNHQHDD